jgi:hypothetical protein
MIPEFKQAKIVHVLDHAATVISTTNIYPSEIRTSKVLEQGNGLPPKLIEFVKLIKIH